MVVFRLRIPDRRMQWLYSLWHKLFRHYSFVIRFVGRYFRRSVMSDVHGIILQLHSLGGGRALTFFKQISLELLEHQSKQHKVGYKTKEKDDVENQSCSRENYELQNQFACFCNDTSFVVLFDSVWLMNDPTDTYSFVVRTVQACKVWVTVPYRNVKYGSLGRTFRDFGKVWTNRTVVVLLNRMSRSKIRRPRADKNLF